MIILLDMDGPLADFEAGFAAAWQAKWPERVAVEPKDRLGFELHGQYPAEYAADIDDICAGEGFIAGLAPTAGALEGVRGLLEAGHDVRVCTAPLSRYRYCAGEKYGWIDRYFGPELVRKLILTKDKTLVRGDRLIDDKPEVTGALAPVWEHLLFDLPNTRLVTGKRRFSWARPIGLEAY